MPTKIGGEWGGYVRNGADARREKAIELDDKRRERLAFLERTQIRQRLKPGHATTGVMALRHALMDAGESTCERYKCRYINHCATTESVCSRFMYWASEGEHCLKHDMFPSTTLPMWTKAQTRFEEREKGVRRKKRQPDPKVEDYVAVPVDYIDKLISGE
jgi:hypothetical protein